MKNLLSIISLLFLITSCTEVVDIDLETANPKLVVEANINWKKGTSGEEQIIKLTTTTNFYNKNIPSANGAIVSVKNDVTNQNFIFLENVGTGNYTCTNFIPIINDSYTLTIIYNGKTFQAQETLTPVAEISEIVQIKNSGFSGKEFQVRAFYLDPQNTSDYYLFNYFYKNNNNYMKPDYYVSDDIFYNGNPFFSVSFKDGLKIGDTVQMTHLGISQQYYNFLNILLSLSGSQGGGGPFQAPPVSVRGNLTNSDNQDDYPYGYFSLSESDSKEYTIK